MNGALIFFSFSLLSFENSIYFQFFHENCVHEYNMGAYIQYPAVVLRALDIMEEKYFYERKFHNKKECIIDFTSL